MRFSRSVGGVVVIDLENSRFTVAYACGVPDGDGSILERSVEVEAATVLCRFSRN